MTKVWLVLQKEMRELLPQRVLLLSVSIIPILLVVMSGILLVYPVKGARLPAASSDPSLSNLSPFQLQQAFIGVEFRVVLLFQALIIPAIIAAYSIVGEKNNRTLEPLLAAPVRTWQLLLAKVLAALLPAVAVTWASSAIFTGEIFALTSPAVSRLVITPGWLAAVVVTVPVMVLIPIALAVMISSRVNDPRAASQLSSLLFIVLLVVFEISGTSLVLSLTFTLIMTAVLGAIGFVLLVAATRIFQRETILTRWS
jgi:ABC-2 type transport system permease protein